MIKGAVVVMIKTEMGKKESSSSKSQLVEAQKGNDHLKRKWTRVYDWIGLSIKKH